MTDEEAFKAAASTMAQAISDIRFQLDRLEVKAADWLCQGYQDCAHNVDHILPEVIQAMEAQVKLVVVGYGVMASCHNMTHSKEMGALEAAVYKAQHRQLLYLLQLHLYSQEVTQKQEAPTELPAESWLARVLRKGKHSG